MTDVPAFPPVADALVAPAVPESARNVGHGHVFPRPDKRLARCGGPGMCRECSQDAVLRAGVEQDIQETNAVAVGRLRALAGLLRDKAPVTRATLLEHLDLALADLAPPAVEEPAAPVKDTSFHSRACGIHNHDHGPACHQNCPTCHGRPL